MSRNLGRNGAFTASTNNNNHNSKQQHHQPSLLCPPVPENGARAPQNEKEGGDLFYIFLKIQSYIIINFIKIFKRSNIFTQINFQTHEQKPKKKEGRRFDRAAMIWFSSVG